MQKNQRLIEALKESHYSIGESGSIIDPLEKAEESVDLSNFFDFILITKIIESVFKIDVRNECFKPFYRRCGLFENAEERQNLNNLLRIINIKLRRSPKRISDNSETEFEFKPRAAPAPDQPLFDT
jgi:hypothetical protein